MLFELCTGDLPFQGSLPQLMTAHSDTLAPRASSRRAGIPGDLDRLIARLLSKEPAMRPTMPCTRAMKASSMRACR